MPGVTAALESVSQAVSSVASVVANYGPSDEKKAVNAAQDAGNKARKLESKKWPAWASGGKEVAKSRGIDKKALYKVAKAEAEDDAFDQAYNQVWDLYQEAKRAAINMQQNQTAQQQLDTMLQQQQAQLQMEQQSKNALGGCAGMAAIILVGGSALTYLAYYLINLV